MQWEYYVYGKESEWTIAINNNMDETYWHVEHKKQDEKEYIIYDSAYVKFLKGKTKLWFTDTSTGGKIIKKWSLHHVRQMVTLEAKGHQVGETRVLTMLFLSPAGAYMGMHLNIVS